MVSFHATFHEESEKLYAKFTAELNIEPTPVYTGEYEITPTITTQTLETKDKRMVDDVTVDAIPYYETTNPSGGYTVIIG